MFMNDELIFDEEDEFLEEPSGQLEPPQQSQEEDDFTSEVLRLKGIADPDKIKFEDESGAIIERSWDSLSREEQLNILVGEEPREEGDNLQQDEIELLNAIRNSGMTIDQYLNSLSPQIQPVKHYKIDELTDDELYALDLLDKVGQENITDEELAEAVAKAKENETLFQKTVEGIRKDYIKLQQDEEAEEYNQQVARNQAAYNDFASRIYDEIQGLNSFAGQSLELSNEDYEELAAFMLDLDDNGVSAFGKALNDPTLFTKAAFWLLNEDQIIQELTRQMQDNYKRGYEAAKKDLNKPAVVFKPSTPVKSQEDTFYVDDDEWD